MSDEMKWRPIETARSGKDMILFFPEHRFGRTVLPPTVRADSMITWGSRKATHWMPVPKFPETAK